MGLPRYAPVFTIQVLMSKSRHKESNVLVVRSPVRGHWFYMVSALCSLQWFDTHGWVASFICFMKYQILTNLHKFSFNTDPWEMEEDPRRIWSLKTGYWIKLLVAIVWSAFNDKWIMMMICLREVILTCWKRSSLAYQFLLYFNGWYMMLYILAEIAIFIWKGEFLPAAGRNFCYYNLFSELVLMPMVPVCWVEKILKLSMYELKRNF